MSLIVPSLLFSLVLSVVLTLLLNAAFHLLLLPAMLLGAILFVAFWHCPGFFCH